MSLVIPFVGACSLIGGLCLGFKEMLTSPKSVNYPTHDALTRVAGAAFATALIYRSIVVLLSCLHGHPRLDDGSVVVSAFFMTLYAVASVLGVLEDKAPAKSWRRMNQIHSVMRCRRWAGLRRLLGLPGLEVADPDRTRIAAAMIAMDGEQVVAPGEVPKDWRPPQ